MDKYSVFPDVLGTLYLTYLSTCKAIKNSNHLDIVMVFIISFQ